MVQLTIAEIYKLFEQSGLKKYPFDDYSYSYHDGTTERSWPDKTFTRLTKNGLVWNDVGKAMCRLIKEKNSSLSQIN